MMTRTIQSPGFETREIDRSQYNRKIDNSLQNAPVCLVLGYADKGDDYIPQWINLRSTFLESYGTPKTEKERYFYNATMEIVDAGGVCIAAKLPYQNEQKQNYTYTEFSTSSFDLSENEQLYKELSSIDSSLTSVLKIQEIKKDPTDSQLSDFNSSGMMNNIQLEQLYSGIEKPLLGHIKIVDILHERYSASYADTVQTSTDVLALTNDCLGIVPVFVSPINAMYFQNVLSGEQLEDMNPVSSFIPCFSEHLSSAADRVSVDISALDNADNLYIPFSLSSKEIFTVSKQLAQQFPTLTWKTASSLDRKHLKDIGVAVLKAFNDTANNNKISFLLLEYFVGSIDYSASREDTSVLYIDDIVNSNSQFIRMFSNFNKADVDSSQIVHVSTQRATSLGFYNVLCKKNFAVAGNDGNYSKDASSAAIRADIAKALSKLDNTTTQQIDLVVDAGMTNIVLEIHSTLSATSANSDPKYIDKWTLAEETDATQWQLALTLFDDFCKRTRKDCMFITDGLRTLCLDGNSKIVNPMLDNSVEKQILPKFKLFRRPDSSYSAGYCNWFMTTDDLYPNIPFWTPPSAKAVRSYINCDTYYHTWDAPAGMTRGKMRNVIDVAFNPNLREADYIYINGWNYAVSYPLDGIVLEGLKTFLSEATALDRVNVRRLMLWLERSVMSMAKYFVYENNTSYTRQRFVDMITPAFERAKNGFGVSDYVIKCDDDLNTPDTIDRNELHVKIAVKPVKTIEHIVISFVLTNLSASVQEEVLK